METPSSDSGLRRRRRIRSGVADPRSGRRRNAPTSNFKHVLESVMLSFAGAAPGAGVGPPPPPVEICSGSQARGSPLSLHTSPPPAAGEARDPVQAHSGSQRPALSRRRTMKKYGHEKHLFMVLQRLALSRRHAHAPTTYSPPTQEKAASRAGSAWLRRWASIAPRRLVLASSHQPLISAPVSPPSPWPHRRGPAAAGSTRSSSRMRWSASTTPSPASPPS